MLASVDSPRTRLAEASRVLRFVGSRVGIHWDIVDVQLLPH